MAGRVKHPAAPAVAGEHQAAGRPRPCGAPQQFDEIFFRMWSFYLKACMGIARSRESHLWQFVLSKKGSLQLYESER